MASRTIGAIALLLGSFAPALAQGPMTPMTLSTSASAVDTASAAPPIPPPPIPPVPVSRSAKTNPAEAITKARPAKDADLAKEADAESDGVVEKPIDAADAMNHDKKKHPSQVDDASSAPPRVDADHMASTLNRMQLDRGGYGSARPDRRPAPLPAGE